MPNPCRFGDFQLLPAERRLLRHGSDVTLTARAFDLLLVLVAHAGQLVGKDVLMQRVWAGLVVEENNLAVQVGALRKLLGAEAIATVAGHGYRFVPQVHAEPAAAPAATRASHLPQPGTPLLGREQDVDAVCHWLGQGRLVTLVGAGGIGKSRLALAVAHRLQPDWPDGVGWVELAGLADPALLPAAIAQTLGIALAGPTSAPTGPTALAQALAGRQALLVVDNCEHLLDAMAALAEALLQGAPGLHLLATSQEPLRLAAEQQYRLNPLAVPPDAQAPDARAFGALALLVARVRAAQPGFELADADLPMAIDLCRRLDGLPLAIELAAARIPLLGLRTVHDRLDERFRLLTAGARTALRRHQTLRAALAWSHGLLDDGQRALFMRLGVFSGGFTLALAQAMCTDEHVDDWAVLEPLAALVEKSLVVCEGSASPRYRLLESARAFALEQLAAAALTPGLLRRHAATMLQFLRQVDNDNLDGLLRTDQYAARVLPELDNLRAAYAWADGADGDRAIAIGLAAHVGPLIDYSLEFVSWLLDQRQHLERVAVDGATAARLWRGMIASNMVGFVSQAEMLQCGQRSVALYRQQARPRHFFSALRLLGARARDAGDAVLAHQALEEAGQLVRPDWPPEFHIGLQRLRAVAARHDSDRETALEACREAVRLARDVSADWRLECIEQTALADALWQFGQPDEAAAMLADLVARMAERPASDFELVDATEIWLWLLSEQGEEAALRQLAREALPVMRRMPRFSLAGCAHLLWRLGRPADAARLLAARAARAQAGLEWEQFNMARLLAAVTAGVQAAFTPAELAALDAEGERLGGAEACAMLERALGAG